MPVVGSEIVRVWNLSDAVDGGPYTGLAGGMTYSLDYSGDGGASWAEASETVAIAEPGAAGIYTARYTPTKAGLYLLALRAPSLGLERTFEADVVEAAGAAAGDDSNAYASVADVQSYLSLSVEESGSIVTSSETQAFLEARAAALYGLMRDVIDDAAPTPTGPAYSGGTPVDTSTPTGYALSRALRQANAVSAAADVLRAALSGVDATDDPRLVDLSDLFEATLPQVVSLARAYGGVNRRRSTHLTSGDVERWSAGSAAGAIDLPVRRDTEF